MLRNFFKDGKKLYIENYFDLIDFIRSLGYEAPKPVSKKSWLWPFFIFFCLTSCRPIYDYRDIEISIENADYATVKVYNLPDTTLCFTDQFDREYMREMHIGSVPDGHILIEVSTKKRGQRIKVDTAIFYCGRFNLGVEF